MKSSFLVDLALVFCCGVDRSGSVDPDPHENQFSCGSGTGFEVVVWEKMWCGSRSA